jgi:hypothetical protein
MKVTDGFRPFVDILHRLTLPPRGTAKNNARRRVLVIAAQHQERIHRSRKGCPHPRCKWCRVKVELAPATRKEETPSGQQRREKGGSA